MRLDKYLCECLFITRTDAKIQIKKGIVTVDEKIVKDPGLNIKEGKQIVRVSGKELKYREFFYYVLNKPAGYVVSDAESDGEPVKNLLPENLKERLKPVGRLDKETSGILLFTDDGVFSHELLSPKKHVEKTYLVITQKDITDEDLDKLRSGVSLGDGEVSQSAKAELGKNSRELFLTITEGKYHQVKRMLQATCNKVLSLTRISFADLSLGELNIPEGEGVFVEKEQIIKTDIRSV